MAAKGVHVLEHTQTIARPLGEVFAFFADAFNLETITPAFLRFRVLTPPPIPMAPVDVQLRGPYRLRHHTHEFGRTAAGTCMRDVVRYALPLGPLDALAHTIAVRRTLDPIFAFRHQRIEEIFA